MENHPDNSKDTYRLNLGDWVNDLASNDPIYYVKSYGGSRTSDWMMINTVIMPAVTHGDLQ